MDALLPQILLALGIALSFYSKVHRYDVQIKKISSNLLQASVVLLGATLSFETIKTQGLNNILVTFISITGTLVIAFFLNKIFKIDQKIANLIGVGTAICGGSAIGAVSPILKASGSQISIAMTVVFLLNAVALFVFPPVGHYFQMTQEQFGQWAALAIHDTSSVVAAGASYGNHALETASTVKLLRALWIIPVTLAFSLLQSGNKKKLSKPPMFILLFIAMSILFTYLNVPKEFLHSLKTLSKYGFALSLFFIGLHFDFSQVRKTGLKPLLFAVLLWVIVCVGSLSYVLSAA